MICQMTFLQNNFLFQKSNERSDNVKEVDKNNQLRLEIPVFLKNSFILPIFNEIFSKELLDILDWLNNYVSDNQLKCNLNLVVSEIIQINHELLKEYDFNKFSAIYSEKYASNLFTRKEFSDVNINAKFNFIKNYAQKNFLTQNNEICIGFIRRKIQSYWKKAEDFEFCLKLMFMDRFLLELSRANHLMI